VAVADRRWLLAAVAAVEDANLSVDRIVPVSWPQQPPSGHFSSSATVSSDDDQVRLCWADEKGVATLELQRGALTRALLPQPLPSDARFSATPAAAAQAEAWLGAPVSLLSMHERALLAATASPWDLRQFELVRRHRGSRALRDVWRTLLGPSWRPVRIGLAALVLVQLAGLNLAAWQMRSEVSEKQGRMVSLLQTTFPHVTGVLDAPLQMQREVQLLRARAGRPGDEDLEPMLLAAAAAWPPGRGPVESIGYQTGQLTLGAAGWAPNEADAFRDRLQAVGYTAVLSDGRLQVRRALRPGAA
jgi:general secretion pathway protein L